MPHFCCGCWDRQTCPEFSAPTSSMVITLVAELGAEAQAPDTGFFLSPHFCPGQQLGSHLLEQDSAWGSSTEVGITAAWMGSSAFSLEDLKPRIPHSCVPPVLAIFTGPTYIPRPFLSNVPTPPPRPVPQLLQTQFSTTVSNTSAGQAPCRPHTPTPFPLTQRKQPSPVDRAMTARIPTAMPAMAPADRDDWGPGRGQRIRTLL